MAKIERLPEGYPLEKDMALFMAENCEIDLCASCAAELYINNKDTLKCIENMTYRNKAVTTYQGTRYCFEHASKVAWGLVVG